MIENVVAQFNSVKSEILSGQLNSVLTRFSDLILVMCLAMVVGMMIVPLPTFLLDVFITVNITVAVTILMVSLYVSSGTQIASYPTLLLLTTLYRLSLEISATRLVLLKADAGDVIRAFGMFVVGGNFVVGAVIFLIITLVQFIVITKGAERVAEVSARFTLDAMPGKQMSIDADLRSGTIDFKEARKRRQALSREAQFYGAMDGAMKFVKGDAIAGIIITVINIVGGLIIGVAMNGMQFSDAIQTYSILTIGDGLVSQIPALLISISAGMVVTRVASEDENTNLGKDIAGQILAQPKAIGVASGILLVMGLIPGLPKIPFLLLAGITGAVSYGLYRAKQTSDTAIATQDASEQQVPPSGREPEVTLTIPLVLEVGSDVAPLVNLQNDEGAAFYERLVQLRNSLYGQMGIIYPPIRISTTLQAQDRNYVFWLNESPVVSGRIRTDALLVNTAASDLAIYGIEAQDARNPATGRAAAWVSYDFQERIQMAGIQSWAPHEVLLMHMANFLRREARQFIGMQETQWILNSIKQYYPTLVDEVVPRLVSLQKLTSVLQRLAEEEVTIRDVKTILESLSQFTGDANDIVALTEHVRASLKRKICFQLSAGKPVLYVYQLGAPVQQVFEESIRQSPNGPYLAMNPDNIKRVFDAATAELGNLPSTAQSPVILADVRIRRFVKRLLDQRLAEVQVISYNELTPEIRVQPIGTITFPELDEAKAELVSAGATR